MLPLDCKLVERGFEHRKDRESVEGFELDRIECGVKNEWLLAQKQ